MSLFGKRETSAERRERAPGELVTVPVPVPPIERLNSTMPPETVRQPGAAAASSEMRSIISSGTRCGASP